MVPNSPLFCSTVYQELAAARAPLNRASNELPDSNGGVRKTRLKNSSAESPWPAVIYSVWRSVGAMESVIVKNPKILGGRAVFRGTRVPLQLLFDSLERGHTLEEFLEGYPTVSREMAIAALEEAQQLLSAKA